MRAGKIVSLIAGILLVLISIGLLIPGGVLLGLYGTQRDDSGFFNTSDRTLTSSGYALVTPDVDLNIGPMADMWLPVGNRAAVRITATSALDAAVFVGIGPSAKVADYLSGVAYDEVTGFGWMMEDVKYRQLGGSTPAALPGEQDFWVASQDGSGTVTLEWDIQDGNWTAVVMNADATAPVSASVSLGARFDILFPIGLGLVIAGVVLLGVGILLIVLGTRRPKTPPYLQAQMQYAPVAPQQPWAPQPPFGGPQPPASPQPPVVPQPPAGGTQPPAGSPPAN
jgi:hypothetical protein